GAGSGYFVNAKFTLTPNGLPAAVTTLKVYAAGGNTMLNTLALPAGYRCFAYGTALQRTDNIAAYNGGALIGNVTRVCSGDAPEIYSINALSGYNAHNSNAGDGVLPVKLMIRNYFIITEKYVDIYGSPLTPPSANTTTDIQSASPLYTKDIPAKSGYRVLGYFIGGTFNPPADVYTPGGTVSIDPVANDITIYFIYQESTALTITKTIAGFRGNLSREFTFTITFADANGDPLPGPFHYGGGAFLAGAEPHAGGALTLDSDGSDTFALKHGQKITIEDVPADCRIWIAETPVDNYAVSFIDGDDPAVTVQENDTTMLPMTTDRVFDFTNTREAPPPSGISLGGTGAALLRIPVLALILMLMVFIGKAASRRQRGGR
ncbi:MAG: hypothetical protein FWF44_09340, partial [Defluviitaleaceae bacterium]|nr:hypothetical protein [Defluviitaleaceae bacterium]